MTIFAVGTGPAPSLSNTGLKPFRGRVTYFMRGLMKSFIATAGALFISAALASTAMAHPESYGPDGLIPHSHTKDGTVISGSKVTSNSASACPTVNLPVTPEVRPTGVCIRLNQGRPVTTHTYAAPTRTVYVAPRLIPVAQPIMQPRIVHQPVVRQVPVVQNVNVVRHVPVVQPVQVVRHVPVVQHVPVVRPFPVAAPVVRHVVPAPAPVRVAVPVAPKVITPVGPSFVTSFQHEGEQFDVINTGLGGMVGIMLIKIVDHSGATKGSWWTTNGHCYTGPAFQHQACWSHAGYLSRFKAKLNPISVNASGGPGPYRSDDPCDHYTKLEAKISQDTSGYCGY